ncbi:hypothetical protein BBK36DRAFT_19268 [Trichoderma citrinoviride]|uniref:Uncharacterized protein n=1 Tax=Trichoderma citrinoviride TaxID=58853 RepID=A0A2T4BEW0_9HYPO|nr:hypothetical protein BBK36DRAFT_19268 [Trichoderma citrinoviride]PTB67781.1 hypothetical protein BBK36DRAFT_19268 [Trichoderma citrinoviride]
MTPTDSVMRIPVGEPLKHADRADDTLSHYAFHKDAAAELQQEPRSTDHELQHQPDFPPALSISARVCYLLWLSAARWTASATPETWVGWRGQARYPCAHDTWRTQRTTNRHVTSASVIHRWHLGRAEVEHLLLLDIMYSYGWQKDSAELATVYYEAYLVRGAARSKFDGKSFLSGLCERHDPDTGPTPLSSTSCTWSFSSSIPSAGAARDGPLPIR